MHAKGPTVGRLDSHKKYVCWKHEMEKIHEIICMLKGLGGVDSWKDIQDERPTVGGVDS